MDAFFDDRADQDAGQDVGGAAGEHLGVADDRGEQQRERDGGGHARAALADRIPQDVVEDPAEEQRARDATIATTGASG